MIVIQGENFGVSQDASRVRIGSVQAEQVVSWADTEIVAEFKHLEIGNNNLRVYIENVGYANGQHIVDVQRVSKLRFHG